MLSYPVPRLNPHFPLSQTTVISYRYRHPLSPPFLPRKTSVAVIDLDCSPPPSIIYSAPCTIPLRVLWIVSASFFVFYMGPLNFRKFYQIVPLNGEMKCSGLAGPERQQGMKGHLFT